MRSSTSSDNSREHQSARVFLVRKNHLSDDDLHFLLKKLLAHFQMIYWMQDIDLAPSNFGKFSLHFDLVVPVCQQVGVNSISIKYIFITLIPIGI